MGKIISMMSRPIRNYNIEQRAHKVISREKPVPAPKYAVNLKQLKIANELNPDFMEKQAKKDSQLDSNLKTVFVRSEDTSDDLHNKSDPKKPLPKKGKAYNYDDLYLYEFESLKEGKCSLKQVQTFLTDHMDDPLKNNATFIAEKYNLDKKVTENVLKYYKVFRIISSEDLERMKEEKTQKPLVTSEENVQK